MFKLTTPVAFFVFNRPERSARVFDKIREAKPPTLLLVADGPRATNSDDIEKCSATREIISRVDWPCQVLTNFAEKNMGCRNRVSSGLKWVFEQVEEAIILEDDCLPHATFFQYCEELLSKYRFDNRIGLISGDNFLPSGYRRTNSSYYFTRYTHIWGWASWRRAIQSYDVTMKSWPELKSQDWIEDLFPNDPAQIAYWRMVFDKVFNGEIDTWDYQLMYSFWVNGFLSINPKKNLISNIGFGAEATHTSSPSQWADLPVFEMEFPLREPIAFNINTAEDEFSAAHVFNIPSFIPSPRSAQIYRTSTETSIMTTEENLRKFYESLVSLATFALQNNDALTALKLLQPCLQSKIALKDINYLCGLSSLVLKDTFAAKRYFESELSTFPENQAAKDMCRTIE